MFGRRRAPAPAPARGPQPAAVAVAPVAVATAAPDTAARAREAGLRAAQGLSLQGAAGGIVGYDRGDPANSVTRVVTVAAQQQPTAAIARVSFADTARLSVPMDATSYDAGTTDPAQNAYQANLLARITRR